MSVAQQSSDYNMNGVYRDGEDTQLQTCRGHKVNIINPRADQIFIEDIAASLSKLCRFNGNCNIFYSVAQHSVLGASLALKHNNISLAKEFLLHDATETYVGDLIRPVKVHIPKFLEIEAGFQAAISEKFGTNVTMSLECKRLDDIMVTWEKRDLMPNVETWPNLPNIDHFKFPQIRYWGFKRAEANFMKLYNSLYTE